MSRHRYPHQRLIFNLASSRYGAFIFRRFAHRLDNYIIHLTKGRTSITQILTGVPVVKMTTMGAKSNLPRTVTVLFLHAEDGSNKLAAIASNWGQSHYPAWYHNLKKNPQATCVVAGQTADYLAYEAEGDEYDQFWNLALDVYPGFRQYKQRVGEQRHIPIMVFTHIDAVE